MQAGPEQSWQQLEPYLCTPCSPMQCSSLPSLQVKLIMYDCLQDSFVHRWSFHSS
jgi:hypothetical protein